MASKRPAGTRPDTIHCDFCGEDYAATYKRCPFCDGKPVPEGAEAEDRYAYSNRRGGGYGGGRPLFRAIGTVVALGVIVAAVLIVVSIIKPYIDRGKTPPVDPNASPNQSAAVSPTFSPTDSMSPTGSPDPNATPDPNAPPPAGQTATGFQLNYQDVTLDSYRSFFDLQPTFTPDGSTGSITYTSGNPEVATVDEKGRVTGLSRGNTTITATLPGASPQTCIVRCGFDAPAGADPSPQPSTGGGTAATPGTFKLNREDFTIKAGESFAMKVSGTSGTPTWSIDKTSVATIGADGRVTGVGKGNATITCTVDGASVTCIVRCN